MGLERSARLWLCQQVEVVKLLTRAISRSLKAPQYIILFLSDHCWMRCRHCWFNESWKEENLRAPTLTYDELSSMADSIDRLMFLGMTGGEAFARRDLTEIVSMFARKTRLGRYQIPTSGSKTDLIVEKTERLVRENPGIPFRVDVSLDGTDVIREEIRQRPGGFTRACETIRALHEVKARVPYFDVGVITTISSYNRHEVEEIAKVVEEVHPESEWMINITRGSVREPACKDVDPGNYHKAHQIIERRIEEGRQRGHAGHVAASWLSAKNAARRKIILQTLRGAWRGGGCAAGSLGGVIYSDGHVYACELLDRSLGNIREFDFDLRALWNSALADELRDWIQDSRCHCTQSSWAASIRSSQILCPGYLMEWTPF